MRPPRTTDLETAGLLKNQHAGIIAWTGPDRLHSRRVGLAAPKAAAVKLQLL